ncbi:helix-turn-helix domain-containing protein [Ilyobacter sp.]|uniref:helix-turn-helix domain-containing protein n=1 Tax=Ilyobacter sp. TaxID=3100343 RepID=UPI0035626CD7
MKKNEIIIIDSIEKLYHVFDLGDFKHPLITVLDLSKFEFPKKFESVKFIFDLYGMSYKNRCAGNLTYGRTHYDFNKGTLNFMGPNQSWIIENVVENESIEGWGLFFHPDLIRRSHLGKKIKEYTFFGYNLSEALHLSEEEKYILSSLVKEIEREYSSRIDNYSHSVINATLELLMNYCERFYSRQFITRENINKDLVENFESFLNKRINSSDLEENGIPTVKECANKMCLSPNYLTDLLKKETGKNTQEYIHLYIIDRAKTMLLNTNDTVGEIAIKLGFEYPDYFSKLFKKKVGINPTKYRNGII